MKNVLLCGLSAMLGFALLGCNTNEVKTSNGGNAPANNDNASVATVDEITAKQPAVDEQAEYTLVTLNVPNMT